MTTCGIDSCSLAPLYVEAFLATKCLRLATEFLWLGHDCRLLLVR
jgi:hypothetical protein